MKFLSIILLVAATASAATVDQVIRAIEIVESNGNEFAANKKENALGCMQLRPIFVADYNRITGFDVEHERALYRPMAYHMTKIVWLHYAKQIDNLTVRHLAYIHNGGGSAWKYAEDPTYGKPSVRKKLEIYYEKVLTQLLK